MPHKKELAFWHQSRLAKNVENSGSLCKRLVSRLSELLTFINFKCLFLQLKKQQNLKSFTQFYLSHIPQHLQGVQFPNEFNHLSVFYASCMGAEEFLTALRIEYQLNDFWISLFTVFVVLPALHILGPRQCAVTSMNFPPTSYLE